MSVWQRRGRVQQAVGEVEEWRRRCLEASRRQQWSCSGVLARQHQGRGSWRCLQEEEYGEEGRQACSKLQRAAGATLNEEKEEEVEEAEGEKRRWQGGRW